MCRPRWRSCSRYVKARDYSSEAWKRPLVLVDPHVRKTDWGFFPPGEESAFTLTQTDRLILIRWPKTWKNTHPTNWRLYFVGKVLSILVEKVKLYFTDKWWPFVLVVPLKATTDAKANLILHRSNSGIRCVSWTPYPFPKQSHFVVFVNSWHY